MELYYILFPVLGYLLGSIPTSVWVGKKYYNLDIREHGSKNAGATNTFRVLGKKAGIIVLLVDVLKGMLAALIPFWVLYDVIGYDHYKNIQILSGISAVIGHLKPIFAQFKGGKGVATSLGIIIGIHPPAALFCIMAFLFVFMISKYISLGSIVASVLFPILIIFHFKEENTALIVFSILLGSMVILAHRANMKRLKDGNESKMNLFKK